MSLGVPEVKAAPALLVAPVLLLSRQSQCIVKIDASHNWYRNGIVITIVGIYPLSFVKWIFLTCQLNYDGDRKKIRSEDSNRTLSFFSAVAIYQ